MITWNKLNILSGVEVGVARDEKRGKIVIEPVRKTKQAKGTEGTDKKFVGHVNDLLKI